MSRVLVLNDCPAQRNRTKRVLLRARHLVAEADARTAVHVFDRFQPDFVLCNLTTPTRADAQALSAIRARRPDVAISGVSADGFPNDPVLLLGAVPIPARSHQATPSEQEELSRAIAYCRQQMSAATDHDERDVWLRLAGLIKEVGQSGCQGPGFSIAAATPIREVPITALHAAETRELLNWWALHPGGSSFAALVDMPHLEPGAVLVEPVDRGIDFEIRYVGSTVVGLYGGDPTGQRFSQLGLGSQVDTVVRPFQGCLRWRRPIALEGCYYWRGRADVQWQCVFGFMAGQDCGNGHLLGWLGRLPLESCAAA
jgi:CheY-like chemotaxis protein